MVLEDRQLAHIEEPKLSSSRDKCHKCYICPCHEACATESVNTHAMFANLAYDKWCCSRCTAWALSPVHGTF